MVAPCFKPMNAAQFPLRHQHLLQRALFPVLTTNKELWQSFPIVEAITSTSVNPQLRIRNYDRVFLSISVNPQFLIIPFSNQCFLCLQRIRNYDSFPIAEAIPSISVNQQFLMIPLPTTEHRKPCEQRNCAPLKNTNYHIYGQSCKCAVPWHVWQLVPVAQVKCE
jgi:hypothetical protein